MAAATPSRQLSEDNRADLLVALVVVVALAVGWVYKNSLSAQMTPAADPNSQFTLSLPSHWLTYEVESADTFISAENPRADSVYKSTLVGKSFLLDPEAPTPLETLASQLVEQHGNELLGFHLLDDSQTATIDGAQARIIEYAYVVQPIDQPYRAATPVVVHALDYVIYTPTEYWIVTLTADEQSAAKEQTAFREIVNSINVP